MSFQGGCPGIRRRLYMGAVVAIHHNPDISSQFARLKARGKASLSALGAAMRKLVHIAYGVLKSQSEYRPQGVKYPLQPVSRDGIYYATS